MSYVEQIDTKRAVAVEATLFKSLFPRLDRKSTPFLKADMKKPPGDAFVFASF